jgi:hypothetical protein
VARTRHDRNAVIFRLILDDPASLLAIVHAHWPLRLRISKVRTSPAVPGGMTMTAQDYTDRSNALMSELSNVRRIIAAIGQYEIVSHSVLVQRMRSDWEDVLRRIGELDEAFWGKTWGLVTEALRPGQQGDAGPDAERIRQCDRLHAVAIDAAYEVIPEDDERQRRAKPREIGFGPDQVAGAGAWVKAAE